MSFSVRSTVFVCGMTWLFLLANVCECQQSRHQKLNLQKAADRPPIKLPGITVDFEGNVVDIEATVCLDKGLLELIACRKGSKEHESIVAVEARAMHIHTALLLLGAQNGNPAMRKQVGTKEKRWVELPAKGDPIEVLLVFKKGNTPVEKPIGDFVIHAQDFEKLSTQSDDLPQKPKLRKFPDRFLFAGSQLTQTRSGPSEYQADKSGHIISVVTFGDELLCLPEIQSQKNGMLSWRIKPRQLPQVGDKVTLRLRPAPKSKKKNKPTKTESPKAKQ